ncbi:hypothetical protein GCM10007071_06920 [Marinobacter zhanjiangensis]|uniref:Lipoprotein n=2 Tax=Marinobacter zhanjiangensis TaxID=578215 RepID=A0ABQ3APG0_9GAMM|nr:hypothetical protein GCM10007071_06920 [Marinobacter zhanjiangensis]
MKTDMKQGMIRIGTLCVISLALQGCASNGDDAEAEADDDFASCDTVFHCPAGAEDVRICRDQAQLTVHWQAPGIDAYQLTGALGDTFTAGYSQRFQVIENTLSWQHRGIHYTAFHYLDESRPETLEEIGITLESRGRSRTISCNDNAVSRLVRLHRASGLEETGPPAGEE